jgi:transposase InsO family protein
VTGYRGGKGGGSQSYSRVHRVTGSNSRNGEGDRGEDEAPAPSAHDLAEFWRWKSAKDYGVNMVASAARKTGPRQSVYLQGTSVRHVVDTGSSVNIIDQITYDNLKHKPVLQPTKSRFFGYKAEEPFAIRGQFKTEVSFRGKTVAAAYIVTEGQAESLLSFATAKALGIVQVFSDEEEADVLSVDQQFDTSKADGAEDHDKVVRVFEAKFPNLFSGKMGCVKGVKVKLDIDPDVRPVRQAQRKVPFHLQEVAAKEIRKQEREGILVQVDENSPPSDWVSNLVIVPKGKRAPNATQGKLSRPRQDERAIVEEESTMEVRLTCDSKALNKALRRTKYPCKTLEDLVCQVNGATRFSKLDITKAFHQLDLDESSQAYTTITTHIGLFRYKKLHMGIASASEVFTETIRVLLEQCDGQLNMTDDIFVYGKTDEEHHNNLMKVLDTLEKSGITLNKSKCEFYRKKLTFFGLTFSENGIAPTEDRCKALREAAAPTCASEMRSFLGLIQYSGRFIKDLSQEASVLKRLTHADVKWQWSEVEQAAFDKLKSSINTKCLAYFNLAWNTEVIVDAGPQGLGAVLVQSNPDDSRDRRIVCFASRGLTDTETRYSQCEKEGIAAVWGCERYWMYLLGKRFTLVTDNRGIQLIFGNAAARPPARIERWALRLSQFDYEIVHRPGASNIADYFSRHPAEEQQSVVARIEEASTERDINDRVEFTLPTAITREQVRVATRSDPVLMLIAKLIQTKGRVELPKQLNEFKHVFDEISSTTDGILLRGMRTIIPASLRHQAVELAHGGHQGIVKTKALIRSRIWFPGIDRLVEDKVQRCQLCQANGTKQSFEPLKPSRMPRGPWEEFAGDFFGPLGDGTYLFVNFDAYSRNVFVNSIPSVAEHHVLPVLEDLFSVYGTPIEYKSDNGSPFQSYKFANFASRMGFKHRLISPLWPRANAEVERFMRNLGTALRTARMTGRPRHDVIRDFLKVYRETPHSTTKVAPNMLMFGFSRTSGLPELELGVHMDVHEQRKLFHEMAVQQDALAKKRMEAEYNARMHVKESKIRVGDLVLLKQKRVNKSTSSLDPEPFVVLSKRGSMVTAARNGFHRTRNSSFFKAYLNPVERPREVPQVLVEQVGNRAAPAVTAEVEQPDDGRVEEQGIADEQHAAEAVRAETRVVRAPGRPSVEQSRLNELARQAEYAAKRAANPPKRSSVRWKGGKDQE